VARGAGPPRCQKLGRIPDGGGHRIHGRAQGARGRGIGYDYVHSAIDDRSRVAFSQILPDETGATCARFLVEAAGFFAEHGVRIQRVLTDNAKAYADSMAFAEAAARLGIARKRTRRYRPQTNGKVERFHKTLLDEWAYGGCTAPTTSAAVPWPGGCGFTSPATTHLARRPDPDGGPRQQRSREAHLDKASSRIELRAPKVTRAHLGLRSRLPGIPTRRPRSKMPSGVEPAAWLMTSSGYSAR
jgi:transposase InsO family protein